MDARHAARAMRRWAAFAVVAALGLVLFGGGCREARCTEPTDADCIRAVYVGAPGDYAEVADIPASALLAPDAEGRYDIRSGQQITVVTAAQLPADATRFLLQRSPPRSLLPGQPEPLSFEQMVSPARTTYTFEVAGDEVGPTLITFDLAAARPGPGPEQEFGDVVVTTAFRILSCGSGIAVPDPAADEVPVRECERLLAIRDTLVGTGTLDWSATRPMTSWTGVTVAGTPRRVTKLDLSDSGLTGELTGLLGTLTALTELRLDGNALTGAIPSKVIKLTLLTDVYLAGNDLEGCVPRSLRAVPNNDVSSLGLPDCGLASGLSPFAYTRGGELLPPGTYAYATLVFDIPPGAWIWIHGYFIDGSGLISKGFGLRLRDEATGAVLCLGWDRHRTYECGRSSQPTPNSRSLDMIFDRIVESMWSVVAAPIPTPAPPPIPTLPPAPESAEVAADRAVLVALYRATGGDDWFRNANWLTGRPLGEWYGVTTGSDGRVTGLHLWQGHTWDNLTSPVGQVSGPIPPELGDLTSLEKLDLAVTHVGGPIPPELGNLASLKELNLYLTDVSGPIPPELGDLASLEKLDLGHTHVSGPIPPELGDLASLKELVVSTHDVSGPIPPELGDLASLEKLDLGGTQVSGPIPPELGDLASLEKLDLGGTQVSGPIPPELGDLANLQELVLSNTQVSGPIPPELADLASLEKLELAGNDLSGPIPVELGRLVSLRWLDLRDNRLSGSIPPELAALPNLVLLFLSSNDFSGCVPEGLRESLDDEERAALGLPDCGGSSP